LGEYPLYVAFAAEASSVEMVDQPDFVATKVVGAGRLNGKERSAGLENLTCSKEIVVAEDRRTT
jgi:hypothetical protein